jgi:hypothetical protein
MLRSAVLLIVALAPASMLLAPAKFCAAAPVQVMRAKAVANETEKSAPNKSWPKPSQIYKELSQFKENGVTQAWADRTQQIVDFICSETEVGDPRAANALAVLAEQTAAIDSLIQKIAYPSERLTTKQLPAESIRLISELQRLKYRLSRRTEIWASACQLVRSAANKPRNSTLQNVSLSRIAFEYIDLDDGWKEYLALEELTRVSRALNPNRKQQKLAARKFLSRLHSPALDQQQKQHLKEHVIDAIDPLAMSLIHEAASGEVDTYRLLSYMEALESDSVKKPGAIAHRLNELYQNLLWSEDPVAQKLAGQIDTHWRNANVRVAINERMLNQMLPQMPATTERITDRIQGAKVSGHGLVENQLRIALIPNPNEISLRLETTGQVTTDTVAERSGFTFQSKGLANFQVFKNLAFNRNGVTSDSPQATSSASLRLVGMRGNYDRIPLVGWLTRKIAKQKVEEQNPEAEQKTRERVESDAKQRVQVEVEEQVQRLRFALNQHVLARLTSMDLEPETVQLSTSQQRISGRYRIAGRDQLAAHQPRPTDFESDLMNFQIHQSAINNLLDRFELGGREFNAVSLGRHIESITGIKYESSNSEAEATFEFSEHDPIRIDFEDGLASVKFGFKRFKIGNGRGWKNISIRAKFKPEYIGTRIILNMDNVFDVDGRNLRLPDELAIRTAFKVILEKQYAFELIPEALRKEIPHLAFAIERLSFADGWFGVTVTEAAQLNRTVPIMKPEEVVPGSYLDQLGAFQRVDCDSAPARTARRLQSDSAIYR